MTTSDPLADQLLEELIASAGRRKRLLATECDDALIEVAPQLRSHPDRRRRLLELLRELCETDRIEWSAARDRTLRPELPAFVSLISGRQDADASDSRPAVVWRPELEWAYELRLTPPELDLLAVINSYRRDRDPLSPTIPHRERSLMLFGDEKRIDRLLRSRLGERGRVSLDLMDCYWAAPPIATSGSGAGGVCVVSENAASWHTLRAVLSDRVAWVAYGAGAAFVQSVSGLVDLGVARIDYIGDLDAEGVAIPQRAAVVAERFGLPAPEPFTMLWQLLVKVADEYGRPATPMPPEVAAELCRWFGATALAANVERLLVDGVRVPQEALTSERIQHLDFARIGTA